MPIQIMNAPIATKTWDELTNYEKVAMREQYIYIRACEDESTEEEANSTYCTDDDAMRSMLYDVERDGSLTVRI